MNENQSGSPCTEGRTSVRLSGSVSSCGRSGTRSRIPDMSRRLRTALWAQACALPLLTSCLGMPDRWSAGVGTGGDLEGPKGGDWERDEWFEVGVSGPIGSAGAPRHAQAPYTTPYPPQSSAAPSAQGPDSDSGLPWADLAMLGLAALGGAGTRHAYPHVRKRLKRTPPS